MGEAPAGLKMRCSPQEHRKGFEMTLRHGFCSLTILVVFCYKSSRVSFLQFEFFRSNKTNQHKHSHFAQTTTNNQFSSQRAIHEDSAEQGRRRWGEGELGDLERLRAEGSFPRSQRQSKKQQSGSQAVKQSSSQAAKQPSS